MKSRLIVVLFALISLPFLGGCNSVAVNVPSSRLDSPEVPGHMVWRVGLGAGSSQNAVYTDDASSRPVTFNRHIDHYDEEIAKGSLGLSDRWEVGFKYGYPGGMIAKAKFQLLGAPASEHVDGNFALAVTGGLGVDFLYRSGDQNGLFGPGGFNWNASATTTILDFGVIAGYRTSEHFIFFGGPYLTNYVFNGSIHQAQSDNGTSPAADYSLTGNGTVFGGTLGAQYYFGQKKKWSIMADIAVQNLNWSPIGSAGTFGGNVMGEFMF